MQYAYTLRNTTAKDYAMFSSLNILKSLYCGNMEQSILEHVFLSVQNGIIITNPATKILYINPAFSKITGYSLNEVIGQTPAILRSGYQKKDFYENMWYEVHQNGSWQGELWNRKKNGELYSELLTINKIYDKESEHSLYIGVFAPINELSTKQENFLSLALYDSLTHLANRALLMERLNSGIQSTKRRDFTLDNAKTNNDAHKLGIFFLDLNKFKPINDQYGHLYGDKILIEVAHRLQQLARSIDTVARYGGDEFVLLFPDVQAKKDITTIAEKLVQALQAPIVVDNHQFKIGVSIGISLYPDDAMDAQTLIHQADQAMYFVKKNNSQERYQLYALCGKQLGDNNKHNSA